ncbi:Matrilin-3 [Exaiptasia diaphana]|nr:Matrilin-3 [Exaiptasia diaphana]
MILFKTSSLCERKIDLGFVIDGSASMGEKNFNYIKKFVKNVIKFFAIGEENTQIGVIPFSHYFKVEIKLNQYSDYGELSKAIDNLAFEGSGSTLAGALKIAQLELFVPENGGRKEAMTVFNQPEGVTVQESEKEAVFQAVVVISDGGSSTGVDALLYSAENLKRSGKRVFVVGLGKHEHMKNIKMMASDPEKTHIFLVENGKQLNSLTKKLADAICKDIKPVMQKFTVSENSKVITSLLYNSGGD